jgi:hypothetical protein
VRADRRRAWAQGDVDRPRQQGRQEDPHVRRWTLQLHQYVHRTGNNFLSHNAHFCKSALARYTQWDFIGLVAKHGVPYHEKKLGQLFCDNKSSDILGMLLDECIQTGVSLHLDTSIEADRQKTRQRLPACRPPSASCAASRW